MKRLYYAQVFSNLMLAPLKYFSKLPPIVTYHPELNQVKITLKGVFFFQNKHLLSGDLKSFFR